MSNMLIHSAGKEHGALRGKAGKTCPCCANGWHRRKVQQVIRQQARQREAREWRREVEADRD